MNLQEIRQKKLELIEAQRKIAEELHQLQETERTVGKAARKDGIDKIKKLIIEFQIPRYEIDTIYRDAEVSFVRKRGPRAKVKLDASPQLTPEKVAKNKDRADQYNRLVETNNLVLLKAKINSLGDELDDVLPFVNSATEAAIIECLG